MPTFRCTLFASDKGDVPATLAFTNNYSATTGPGVSNDSTQGYGVGSAWTNTATGTAYQCLDATAGAAVWAVDANGSGLGTQGAPATQDTAATLTAAQLLAGILISNPSGAIALTLPLATAMDTALPKSAAGNSFDFSVINISATGGAIATMTTNTGWTVTSTGAMAVAITSSAHFRARKTATGAWTLYRLS